MLPSWPGAPWCWRPCSWSGGRSSWVVGILWQFPGEVPWGRFGIFTLISWAVSMMVYALQQGLSLRFANQAVALVCGISGSFLGILSLLFPPALTRCVPLGLLRPFVPGGDELESGHPGSPGSTGSGRCPPTWCCCACGRRCSCWWDGRCSCGRRCEGCCLRCLRAELIKFRRSPVWLAFVVLPIFPAILGTMN